MSMVVVVFEDALRKKAVVYIRTNFKVTTHLHIVRVIPARLVLAARLTHVSILLVL